MILPGEYKVLDTWFTTGMCGTGSNTIVTDEVFVPGSRVLALPDLRQGKGPGGLVNDSPIFRTPFFFYAPLTFAGPMLGVRMARAAADLDAAELLLRRATQAHVVPEGAWPQLLARSVRDFARVSEFAVAAIDTLISLSGAAAFATSHPIQRAWRDIHFAASHIGLNTETNYALFWPHGAGPWPRSNPAVFLRGSIVLRSGSPFLGPRCYRLRLWRRYLYFNTEPR